jgi:hypothetical protein
MNCWSARLCALIIALQIPSFAQNQFGEPIPPLRGPGYAVGLGYEYLAMQESRSIPFTGLDTTAMMEFNRKWAATVDLSYVRTSNVLGTGRDGYVLNILAGPEFCLKKHRNSWVFVHAIGGSALVESALRTNDGDLHGWVARPAFGAGGGIETLFRRTFGIRMYGDYGRTSFAHSVTTIEPRDTFRSVISLVFRLPFTGTP